MGGGCSLRGRHAVRVRYWEGGCTLRGARRAGQCLGGAGRSGTRQAAGKGPCSLKQVTTGGCPSVPGTHPGFVALLKACVPAVVGVHCVIHEDVLCAKLAEGETASSQRTTWCRLFTSDALAPCVSVRVGNLWTKLKRKMETASCPLKCASYALVKFWASSWHFYQKSSSFPLRNLKCTQS